MDALEPLEEKQVGRASGTVHRAVLAVHFLKIALTFQKSDSKINQKGDTWPGSGLPRRPAEFKSRVLMGETARAPGKVKGASAVGETWGQLCRVCPTAGLSFIHGLWRCCKSLLGKVRVTPKHIIDGDACWARPERMPQIRLVLGRECSRPRSKKAEAWR